MDKKAVLLVGLAFELTGLIIALIYVGRYLDHTYSLKGMGVAGGALLALIIWVMHVMFVLRDKDPKDPPPGNSNV